MDTQPKQSASVYELIAWANENRKRLIGIGAVLVALAAIIGIYDWHVNYRLSEANAAYCRLKPPSASSGGDAAAYLAVANEYQDTSAGARALLLAGGLLFEAGKFEDAQKTFERFMATHHDYPLASEALAGWAASLEAQGKRDQAIARFEDMMRRPQDATTLQIRLSLGRLYEKSGKYEQALRQYMDLVQANSSDSWSTEARGNAQDLLAKHPELRQKLAPPPSAPPAAPTPAPAAP